MQWSPQQFSLLNQSLLATSKSREHHIPAHVKKILNSWNLLYSKMPQMLTLLLLVSSPAPIANHLEKHSPQIISTLIPSAKVQPPQHNPILFKVCKVTPVLLATFLQLEQQKKPLQVPQESIILFYYDTLSKSSTDSHSKKYSKISIDSNQVKSQKDEIFLV